MTAPDHLEQRPDRLRVLHVEDNELDAELVTEALRRGGFSVSVTVVQAASEFEQQLRAQRPDVVIADYNLPQWKGMEALAVLRREGLDIPLILVSGALGDVTAVECIKAGATDYVLKDGLARLPEAVRRALREKHLREQHIHSEELFRRAVESSPSGIVMVDESCKILLANTETERLFGYGRDQMVGQPVEMLVPSRLHEVYSEHGTAYHRAPGKRVLGARGELYARRQDGSEFPVEIGLNPIETASGTQTLISVVDITARKQAETAELEYTRELQRSNSELEQFAYIASHDLQEPLRMVASYTELLAERYRGKLDDRADKYIGYAVDGARRMQRLIHDLLAYARVSSQAKPLQPTDTAVLLASVVAMMSKTIENSKAEVLSENMPTVRADELQLGQVFQNLLGNALKFHGERAPRIQVRAESIENEKMWRFSVADNGIGIDKENGGRLFQMFQRLHTREEYEGTGIGLAISKRIVERHAGRIWFDSALGQGTTFYFTLPRPERCAMTTAIQILLVEDNPGDADLTRESLEASKLRIELSVVVTGAEALDFMHRRGGYVSAPRPDLILLDLNLPRIDGRAVLEDIKRDADLKRIPVCILTSSAAETDVVQGYNLGANCYVVKPLDFKTFQNIVQAVEGFWFTIVKLPAPPEDARSGKKQST